VLHSSRDGHYTIQRTVFQSRMPHTARLCELRSKSWVVSETVVRRCRKPQSTSAEVQGCTNCKMGMSFLPTTTKIEEDIAQGDGRVLTCTVNDVAVRVTHCFHAIVIFILPTICLAADAIRGT
jgi:hypothetical protein